MIDVARHITILLAALVLLETATAQEFSVEVERSGRFDAHVTAKAGAASVRAVLAAVVRKTEFQLRVPDAATTETLEATRIDIGVEGMALDRIVSLLCGAADLHASIDFENRTIHVKPFPASDAPGAAEFYRLQALAELLRAYGGDDDPEREVELLWRSAELHVAGGNYGTAHESLHKLITGYKSHPRAPEACLLAGRCALKAGDAVAALAKADFYLNEYPRRPGTVKARILAVQSYLARSNIADARSLLRGIIRDGRGPNVDERDVLIAELLLADLHHRTNEQDEALDILEQVRWRHDPSVNKDLLGQVPLFIGLAHRAQDKFDRAVHDFRLAAYTCATPLLRGRALRAQAETFLRLGSPFESLSATRVAMQLDPQGQDLVDTRRLEARAYRAMFLDVKAIDLFVELLEKLPEIVPDETARDVVAAGVLEELGGMLFAAEDWERARDVFARVRGVEGIGPRAVLMMARSELRSGNAKRALEILDEMPQDATADATRDALELRGDCYIQLKLYERAINVWQGEGE